MQGRGRELPWEAARSVRSDGDGKEHGSKERGGKERGGRERGTRDGGDTGAREAAPRDIAPRDGAPRELEPRALGPRDRGIRGGMGRTGGGREPDRRSEPIRIEETRMWHITLTVAGPAVPQDEIRRALEQLAYDHPFLLAGRYAPDHAEIRYWEEARDLQDAAALALRLWGEHRRSAGLPPWEIVGLEVVDRGTWQQRAKSPGPGPIVPGGVQPF